MINKKPCSKIDVKPLFFPTFSPLQNHWKSCTKMQNNTKFELLKTFNCNKLFKLNKLSYLQCNYCIFITSIIDFTNIDIYEY